MKMYVKPSIEVIELQLKENIAAVPTTVYKGSKSSMSAAKYNEKLALSEAGTGILAGVREEFGISIL